MNALVKWVPRVLVLSLSTNDLQSIYKLSTNIASLIVIDILFFKHTMCPVKILELTDDTALENQSFYLVSRILQDFLPSLLNSFMVFLN